MIIGKKKKKVVGGAVMPLTVTFIKLIYFFIVNYHIIITNQEGVWQALAVMEWIWLL